MLLEALQEYLFQLWFPLNGVSGSQCHHTRTEKKPQNTPQHPHCLVFDRYEPNSPGVSLQGSTQREFHTDSQN